jgi:hypothetical protein
VNKLNGTFTLPIQVDGCSRLKYTDFKNHVLDRGFEQASNILPKYGRTGRARFVKLFHWEDSVRPKLPNPPPLGVRGPGDGLGVTCLLILSLVCR